MIQRRLPLPAIAMVATGLLWGISTAGLLANPPLYDDFRFGVSTPESDAWLLRSTIAVILAAVFGVIYIADRRRHRSAGFVVADHSRHPALITRLETTVAVAVVIYVAIALAVAAYLAIWPALYISDHGWNFDFGKPLEVTSLLGATVYHFVILPAAGLTFLTDRRSRKRNR